jgi:hypothetical protein
MGFSWVHLGGRWVQAEIAEESIGKSRKLRQILQASFSDGGSLYQSAIGLGNQPTQLLYEIPKATLCFQHHCLSLKFLLTEIPVACILGTPFFVVVEPQGSTRLPNKSPGYFISIPSPTKTTKISIQLPFVSIPRISSHIHIVQNKVIKIEELKGKRTKLIIKEQISQSHIQQQILELQREFEAKVCSENPITFWHHKRHEVELPYKDSYEGTSCKRRSIPMNAEYQNLCSNEIQGLLQKGLIRESISP